MREVDLPTLLAWLAKPHVTRWWSPATTLDEVRQAYLPAEPAADAAHPFFAWADERAIAYAQVYPVAAGGSDWWPDEVGPGVVGMDLLIGSPDHIGRGWGTALVSQFLGEVIRDSRLEEVRVDPHPDNVAARKCYRNAGFEERGPITTPDGPAILMIHRRPSLDEPREGEGEGEG